MSLLIAALTPVLIFLYIIYKGDTTKKPWAILAKCFFGGAFLVVILSLCIYYFIIPKIPFAIPVLDAFYKAFFMAAIPEEIAKFTILYYLTWRSEEFEQYYDGIIYAISVSLGLAFTENIMYVASSGVQTAIGRILFSTLSHVFFGIAMGYYYSIARFSSIGKYRKQLKIGVFSAIILHGIYKFILLYAITESLRIEIKALLIIIFAIFTILLWKLGLKKIKEHIERDKNYQDYLENQNPEG